MVLTHAGNKGGKGRMLITIVVSVFLFALLAVGVSAGISKMSANMELSKSNAEKEKLQQYGIDNIDYKLDCTEYECILILNKYNVFQDRRVKFDTKYQDLIKEAVLNQTDGSTISEAVYETRVYTDLELRSIANTKADAELDGALAHFESVQTTPVKKLEVEGKVKV